jgi:hypothetical protein
MCLNQILKNEQITLMRHAAANKSRDIGKYRLKLNMFEKLLKAHPYPHRPYFQYDDIETPSGPSPALAKWENEGGAC